MTLRVSFLTIFLLVSIEAREWPEFRGPNAQGVVTAKDVPSKINLIPFNPFPNSGYSCSKKIKIKNFQKVLLDSGIVTTIRKTRGDDIYAACGQLIGQVQDKTKRTYKIKNEAN